MYLFYTGNGPLSDQGAMPRLFRSRLVREGTGGPIGVPCKLRYKSAAGRWWTGSCQDLVHTPALALASGVVKGGSVDPMRMCVRVCVDNLVVRMQRED